MEKYFLASIVVLNLITAILALITAIMAWRTHTAAQRTEVNTNSMREALVISTGKAAHADGLEQGRQEGEDKAAALVKSQHS